MSTFRFVLLWLFVGWWWVPILYAGLTFTGWMFFDWRDGILDAREATRIFWRIPR